MDLTEGAAIIGAQAELPSLLTGPGEGPIRTGVTIRAKPDGSVKLDGVTLKAPQAYLGAVKVKDLDLLYDGGLTIRGKLLFPPVDAGIEIQEFRLDNRGNFKALVLAYLAGAGQGIPVGPGVFLTKIGGGFSLDPDEVRALAAVSIGPSAGGGCPIVGADGSMVVHFGPAPFFISTNVDLQLVCLTLAHVDFFFRGDGYTTLGANFNFDAGPLYFSAAIRGSLFLPNWQVEGEDRAASARSSAPPCGRSSPTVASPPAARWNFLYFLTSRRGPVCAGTRRCCSDRRGSSRASACSRAVTCRAGGPWWRARRRAATRATSAWAATSVPSCWPLRGSAPLRP